MPSFVENDLNILKKHFDVFPICLSSNLLVNVPNLIRSIIDTNMIFVWFAGFQAFVSVFLSKFFGKKLVVVAGGYDAAYVPEINYGVFTCWWRKIMAIFVYKNANLVLAVSKYTKKELLQHIKPKKISIIYNGVDVNKFVPFGKKEKFVLTVGNVNWSNIKKKGLETFVRTSKLLPKVQFILVGRHMDDSINYLMKIAGKNVEFTGYLSLKEILKLYQRAMIYAQLSYHESFGVSLAEAMSCECMPIVTKRTALPEVVSTCGTYVPYDNESATAEAIELVFKTKNVKECTRDRVITLFSLEKRERNLIRVLYSLFNI